MLTKILNCNGLLFWQADNVVFPPPLAPLPLLYLFEALNAVVPLFVALRIAVLPRFLAMAHDKWHSHPCIDSEQFQRPGLYLLTDLSHSGGRF